MTLLTATYRRLCAVLLSAVTFAVCAFAQEPSAAVLDAHRPDAMTYAAVSRQKLFDLDKAVKAATMIEDEERDAIVADLLSYASSLKGVRYQRGGSSKRGFDCSGFTSHVFGQFGYDLLRSSRAQFTQGVVVERDEVVPGDLLFFKGRSSKSSTVGHVGIAISVDAETGIITFIHAAINGGIRIDRTSAPYYSARYLGARRIF